MIPSGRRMREKNKVANCKFVDLISLLIIFKNSEVVRLMHRNLIVLQAVLPPGFT